jgi:hypothetical protein
MSQDLRKNGEACRFVEKGYLSSEDRAEILRFHAWSLILSADLLAACPDPGIDLASFHQATVSHVNTMRGITFQPSSIYGKYSPSSQKGFNNLTKASWLTFLPALPQAENLFSRGGRIT